MLDNITAETERVRAAFTSPDGLTRLAAEDQRHVAFTVVMVVTDERVLFLNGDTLGSDPTMDAGTLEYADLAGVSVEAEADTLELSTVDGITWRFPLPDGDSETVDAVCRHLRWVGELRSRLLATKNDVELAAGEIRELAEEMDWDEAKERYAEVRDRVDTIIDAVQWTEPIADEVVAPELTEMERTLEEAVATLYIECSSSRLTLGQQLVENGDFEQARKVLAAAQEDHETASGHADAVERGDAFQFGQQRELGDRLERLAWEIEAVAAEPIRQAHEAKILGESTSDPEAALKHWETAFERYANVLTLEWGEDDRYFAGDTDDVAAEMEGAGAELIALHRTIARREWDEGVHRQEADEIKAAMRTYESAIGHLERAIDLAAEFRPDATAEMETRLELMRSGLQQVRDTETPHPDRHPVSAEVDVDGDPSVGAPPDAEGDDGTTGDEIDGERSEKTAPDAGDIAELDTHHDIAMDRIETENEDTGTDGTETDGTESDESPPEARETDWTANGHDCKDTLVRTDSGDGD